MIQAILNFPEIDPRLFHFELFGREIALRWYALAYIVGILFGLWMAKKLVSRASLWRGDAPPMTKPQLDDLVTWIILGVVIGGRLGSVLFYNPGYYLQNPQDIIRIWDGGMSFHGGLIGVIVAAWVFTTRHHIAKLSAADVLAFCTPPALFFGRLANFINAELWGRPSDVAWAMKFPSMCVSTAHQGCSVVGEWFYTGFEVPRHPSQLYEAALEGLLLGLVLLYLAYRTSILKRPGFLAAVFFAGYGISRFIVEFFRQADSQFITDLNPMGFVIGTNSFGITMGQLLSLPMVAIAVALFIFSQRASRR